MPDPLEFDDDKFESLFQSEILTYLSLKHDIQASVRRVCKRWKNACQVYKNSWIQVLDDRKRSVVLLELASAKGKTLNGNIVSITGNRNAQQRYQIQIQNRLTGETERLTIKICNLYPNATTTATHSNSNTIPDLLQYTNNAKLRRSHGMMLDQILMLARWETNIVNGMMFDGSYHDFMNLSRSNPIVARLNSNMWTWWTTPPKLAGIKSPGTILDVVTKSLISNDPSRHFAKEDKLWVADGPSGEWMARNFVKFMRSWPHHRVSARFWVVRKFKTGSILVATDDEDNENCGFGRVYLVKGHNSVIAELVPQTPFCCRATLLPLYDCWTYDGCVTVNRSTLSPSRYQQLEQHVQTAILNKTVSWCYSPTPSQKQWRHPLPPPPFPTIKFENENEVELNWDDYDDDGSNNYNPNTQEQEVITTKHMELGRKIVKLALKGGGIDFNVSELDSTWVIRRYGYSYTENPNGIAYLSLSNGAPFVPIECEVDHDRGKTHPKTYVPTYKLQDVLQAIVRATTTKELAKVIAPDELAVVGPLQQILDQCFQEQGANGPTVNWYPPASEEESAYAGAFGMP